MVECGFPTSTPGWELMEYAETPEDPTNTVYGYVPVDVVRRELESHGMSDVDIRNFFANL